MSFLFDPSHWDLSNPTSISNLLLAQLYITFVSLAIALIIAFPIALLVARYRRLYTPVITSAGILYTIPSLAAFVLLIPITGFAAGPTVIIPLVIYSQIVLIRNIVAAIHAVDPALVEVGRAMGMSGWQLQRRVVLPLALPVIVAGVRVATVTAIGIATLGYLVGVETIGFMIQQGINYGNSNEPIAGAILVSALAIAADLLLLGLQRWLARGREVATA
jgi:osmoprotectant transport system permease protein